MGLSRELLGYGTDELDLQQLRQTHEKLKQPNATNQAHTD